MAGMLSLAVLVGVVVVTQASRVYPDGVLPAFQWANFGAHSPPPSSTLTNAYASAPRATRFFPRPFFAVQAPIEDSHSGDEVLAELDALRAEIDEVKKELSESEAKGTDTAGVRAMREGLARLRTQVQERSAKAKEAAEESVKSKADSAANALAQQSRIMDGIQQEFANDLARLEDGMMFPFGRSLMLDFNRPFRQMASMEESMNRVKRQIERSQAQMYEDTPELDDIVQQAVNEANEEGKTSAQIVKETPDKKIDVTVERGMPGQKTVQVRVTRMDNGAVSTMETQKIESEPKKMKSEAEAKQTVESVK